MRQPYWNLTMAAWFIWATQIIWNRQAIGVINHNQAADAIEALTDLADLVGEPVFLGPTQRSQP